MERVHLYSDKFQNADFLDLPQNRGKAEAVRLGFLKALEKNPQTIGFWDADLATPLEEAPEFYRLFESRPKLLCVMGSRILRMGGRINRHLYRHIIGRVFATFASNALGLPVYDTQCGAKIFKASIVSEVFKQPFLSYWIFDVELIYRIKKISNYSHYNDNFYEYPLSIWNDEAGSKLKMFDFLKAPFELLKIWWHYR